MASALENRVVEIFNPLSARSPLALRQITLVGGYSTSTLEAGDHDYLEFAFHSLRTHNIPLHPDFSLGSINLDRQNRDFLKEQPPSDLLIVCFIHNPDPEWGPTCMKHPDHMCGISPMHYQPEIWAQSAEKSGARAIYVEGGVTEISGQHFEGDTFLSICQTFNGSFNRALLLRCDYAEALIANGTLPAELHAKLAQKLRLH